MQLRLKLKRERMDRDVLSTEYIDTPLPQYVVHLDNVLFHPAVDVVWGLESSLPVVPSVPNLYKDLLAGLPLPECARRS